MARSNLDRLFVMLQLARILDTNRDHYDAFVLACGTDTLS